MPLQAMKEIFSEEAKLQRWLDVECTLANVEAFIGLIPQEAAGTYARASG